MPSPKELLFEDDVVEGLEAVGYRLLDASGFDLELGLNPEVLIEFVKASQPCLLYTSPSPRDQRGSRMPSSA